MAVEIEVRKKRFGEIDPDKALILVQKTGLMNEEIASDIVIAIAEKHGVARAGETVKQLPSLPLCRHAASTVLSLWVKEDITAAYDWIQTLPDPRVQANC